MAILLYYALIQHYYKVPGGEFPELPAPSNNMTDIRSIYPQTSRFHNKYEQLSLIDVRTNVRVHSYFAKLGKARSRKSLV